MNSRVLVETYARVFIETVLNTELVDALERECQIMEVTDTLMTLVGIYYLLVLKILRGEDLELMSRELGAIAADLSG